MTPEFFDHVMLGVGCGNDDGSRVSERDSAVEEWRARCGIPRGILDEMRREFEYFYPVDFRHSGRDLVPNHLTFFVLNHVAIFEKKMWPRGIVVNGSVLMDGSKMSKSMGNIIPLRKAIREFGADPIRLAIIISAELLQDADFNMESVHGMRSKLESMHAECAKLAAGRGDDDGAPAEHSRILDVGDFLQCAASECAEDAWLFAKMRRMTSSVTSSIEKMRLRESLHLILYEAESALQWHARRSSAKGRPDSDVRGMLHAVMTLRVAMLRPFAPHVTESMWDALGHATDADGGWPVIGEAGHADHMAVHSEYLLQSTLDDIASILKVTKMTPSRIVLYVSGESSPMRAMYDAVLQSISDGEKSMKQVMGRLMSGPHAPAAKKMPGYIQKAIKDVLSDPEEIREARLAVSGSKGGAAGRAFAEYEFLASELPAIASAMFGASVDVYAHDDPDVYDPKSKARHARPFKPAILIE